MRRSDSFEGSASILPSKFGRKDRTKFVELSQVDDDYDETIALTSFDASSFAGNDSDQYEFDGDDLLSDAHEIMRQAAAALEETRQLDDGSEDASFEEEDNDILVEV